MCIGKCKSISEKGASGRVYVFMQIITHYLREDTYDEIMSDE